MERSGSNTDHQYGGSSFGRSRESLLADLEERARDSESPDSFFIRNDLAIEAPYSQSLAEFCGLDLYETLNVALARRGSEPEKREQVGNDVQLDCSEGFSYFERDLEDYFGLPAKGSRPLKNSPIELAESVERSHGQRRDDDDLTLDWPLLGCDPGTRDQRARSASDNEQIDRTNIGETSTMQSGTSPLLTALDFEYLLEQDKMKREAKKKRKEQKRSSQKPK